MCVVNRYTKGIVGGVFKETLVVLRIGKKGEKKKLALPQQRRTKIGVLNRHLNYRPIKIMYHEHFMHDQKIFSSTEKSWPLD
jgi:hypothetical protein